MHASVWFISPENGENLKIIDFHVKPKNESLKPTGQIAC